ncbi:winged helix-turn-helix transcriptional regulator [Thermogemmatispora onikobensis]|uniref:winged helix-turn-helix transcriptional regulator n=1 Tax=Thermogemmatispora onikobensis TaxID=732234 RepID=UPI000A022FE1|nr:helix-turn-helix domain-containing protein [Thermogemmatispora onikobensis]
MEKAQESATSAAFSTPSRPQQQQPLRPITQLCPRYEHAMQILGKRWTGLLIASLLDGPRRFGELTTIVGGLSDRVLSERLRELEQEGIVERVVYPHIPVRVEYQLTEKGRALKPVIDAIHAWAERWIELPLPPSSCQPSAMDSSSASSCSEGETCPREA